MDNIKVKPSRMILKQPSTIVSIKSFNKLFKTKPNSQKTIKLSEKAAQVINKIGNTLKYQRNIRSEY